MTKNLVMFLIILVLSSCGSTKIVKESRQALKGYWNLDEINYNNTPGIYKVTLFGSVSSECMVGSKWRFIPNNNFGNYELVNGECSGDKNYFVWSIPEEASSTNSYEVLLKPTDEKMKSTMNNKGYRLNIQYLSEDTLQFTQTVTVDGSPFTIVMNFSKIAD